MWLLQRVAWHTLAMWVTMCGNLFVSHFVSNISKVCQLPHTLPILPKDVLPNVLPYSAFYLYETCYGRTKRPTDIHDGKKQASTPFSTSESCGNTSFGNIGRVCGNWHTLEILGTKWLTNKLPHIVTHIAKVCHATRCNSHIY